MLVSLLSHSEPGRQKSGLKWNSSPLFVPFLPRGLSFLISSILFSCCDPGILLVFLFFCLRHTPALTPNRSNISTAALSTSKCCYMRVIYWVLLHSEENTDQVQVWNTLPPHRPSISLYVPGLSDHTSSLVLNIFCHTSLFIYIIIYLFIFSFQTVHLTPQFFTSLDLGSSPARLCRNVNGGCWWEQIWSVIGESILDRY